MQRPQQYTANVTKKELVTPKVTKLELSLLNGQVIAFKSGQFVNLKCPYTAPQSAKASIIHKYRAYSIASDFGDTANITLYIETGHQGVASNYVNSIAVGDTVELIGPSGKFFLREELPKHLVFYATGTGVAPFFAMFYELQAKAYPHTIDLHFGVRHADQVIEPSLLQSFKSNLACFNYTIYTSQDTSNPQYISGRITDGISADLDVTAQYYVCGNPAMVADVSQKLLELGVSIENIITEGFTHSAH